MTDSLSAYQSHEFIRISIDLLASGVAWRGGSFSSSLSSVPSSIAKSIDEGRLAEIATQMLLQGRSLIRVVKQTDNSVLLELLKEDEADSSAGFTAVERVESSFLPSGRPILEPVLPSIDLYEQALQLGQAKPSALELLKYALPSIHSALAIPPTMLDQARISKTPPEFLMLGAIQFKSEVRSLRHNIQFGLDRVGEGISQVTGVQGIEWEWNEDWIPAGPCKYGHVYQVFSSMDLLLEPIRASELGGLQLAADNAIISRSTLGECASSYGV